MARAARNDPLTGGTGADTFVFEGSGYINGVNVISATQQR